MGKESELLSSTTRGNLLLSNIFQLSTAADMVSFDVETKFQNICRGSGSFSPPNIATRDFPLAVIVIVPRYDREWYIADPNSIEVLSKSVPGYHTWFGGLRDVINGQIALLHLPVP